jgi:hypothetical protein
MTFLKTLLTAALLVLPLLGGCADNKTRLLGIVGYNYTDRYIDSFEVGGQGGGNVLLSDGDSGGGSTSCCIGFNPRTPLPLKMKVRWTFGYKRDAQGNIIVPNETREATAELRGPVPDDPHVLEVHFMPDGTVQLRITYDQSPPMLVIDRSKKAH